MGYKMKGWSGYQNSPAKQNGKKPTGKKRLKGTENPDTAITGGSKTEEINDLEDRIEFLQHELEDGGQQPGQNPEAIKKDIASLEEELKAARGEERPDPEWENADEVD